MGIVDEDIVRVRDAADIVAVISQHLQLKKVGRRWTGLCPFHQEKSPSFSVNAEEGLYYCFGCRASGDTITFVREIEHLDFVAAVERLASSAGVTLHYTDDDGGESRKRNKVLHETMERAVSWYHDRLITSPDAGPARAYLRSRGFDRDLVEEWRLGWAPDSWDELSKHLGAPTDVLVDCGLGFENRIGRQQDFFRARLLFPIFDDQGRATAFGGRKLPDSDGPKYQNSRENPLYNKSRTLYGLDRAKADIVNAGEVIVCEGYTDVVGFFRAAMPRAVATCGTSLTEDHVRSLSRFTHRILLAYDADEAGQSAAERVYAWEEAHGLEFRVLGLPAGSDPDDLSRTDPDALVAAVDEAKPFLAFRVDRVLAAASLDTPEGRARAADDALEVITEHPSPLVRDQYLMQVAGFCRIDEDHLRARMVDVAARPKTPAQPRGGRSERGRTRGEDAPHPGGDDAPPLGELASAPARRPEFTESPETEALRLMIREPEAMTPRLHRVLFADPLTIAAYDALVAAGSVGAAIESSSAEIADFLNRLAVEDAVGSVDDVAVRLVDRCATRAVRNYERRARTDDDPLSFVPVLGWLKLQVELLSGDEPEMEPIEDLLAWLIEHEEEIA